MAINSRNILPCVTCVERDGNICAALMGKSPRFLAPDQDFSWQAHETAGAGQLICARGEPCNDVYVLCYGWALRLMQLADGRRQILSVILPGDIFSTATLFEDRFPFSIRALTDVRYCRMNVAHIRSQAAVNPKIWDAIAKACMIERRRADELVTDLGRRAADERIANLILGITERLGRRQVPRDLRYDFPLRQQHIADITGLTVVHVSRIINTFRRANLFELSKGILTIFNQPELERIGRLR